MSKRCRSDMWVAVVSPSNNEGVYLEELYKQSVHAARCNIRCGSNVILRQGAAGL